MVGAARGDREHGGQFSAAPLSETNPSPGSGVQFRGQYCGVRLVAAQGHFGVVDGVAQVLVVEPACVGQRGAD